MRIGEFLFIGWAVLIALWWIVADPESAPQQAALAGQALVLVVLPYCVLAALQRGRAGSSSHEFTGNRADRSENKPNRITESKTSASEDLFDVEILNRPGGLSTLQSRAKGGKGDDGAAV